MDISMDIHEKSVDMDMDMDDKCHIHSNPANFWVRTALKYEGYLEFCIYRRTLVLSEVSVVF